mgnify:FL=1
MNEAKTTQVSGEMPTERLPIEVKEGAADELAERRQELESLGLNLDKVARVQLEMNWLRRRGLLVDLDITGTQMFKIRATKAEIGILEGSKKAERYTIPSVLLIPKSKLNELLACERRLRKTLDKSYVITGFRPYRWIPYTMYPRWKEEWNRYLEEFNAIKQEIIENYDGYIDILAKDIAAGARETWDSMKKRYRAQGLRFQGRVYENVDEFVDAVVNHTLSKFPSVEKIQENLKADYRPAVVFSDIDFAALESRIKVERAKADAAAKEAYLQASILQEQYDHVRRMHQKEEQEKDLQLEAMFRGEMERVREMLANVRSPFEEVILSLRDQIAQDAQEMLRSIEKNGFVKGKIAEKAHALLEFYKLFAIFDDHELHDRLMELKKLIGDVGKKRAKNAPPRDIKSIKKTLEKIADLAHAEVESMTKVSRADFLVFED